MALFGCPCKCRYCINLDILSLNKYKEYTVSELLSLLLLDYCYYVGTGGGVTFGGGEPLLQKDVILEFKRQSPQAMHVNVETSLNTEVTDDIFKELDELIIDVKSLNPSIYKAYTGLDNEKVLSNLKRIAELGFQNKCHIKIPVIPSYTTKEMAQKDRECLKEQGFENIEILDYVIRDYMN